MPGTCPRGVPGPFVPRRLFLPPMDSAYARANLTVSAASVSGNTTLDRALLLEVWAQLAHRPLPRPRLEGPVVQCWNHVLHCSFVVARTVTRSLRCYMFGTVFRLRRRAVRIPEAWNLCVTAGPLQGAQRGGGLRARGAQRAEPC